MASTKIELDDGTIQWKNEDGKLHREDGPATIEPNGCKVWRLNGQLHRTDGPAVIKPNDYDAWWAHGLRHRPDGPAVIRANGHQEWWVEGLKVSEDDFKRWQHDQRELKKKELIEQAKDIMQNGTTSSFKKLPRMILTTRGRQ